jgi:hypothetical protein
MCKPTASIKEEAAAYSAGIYCAATGSPMMNATSKAKEMIRRILLWVVVSLLAIAKGGMCVCRMSVRIPDEAWAKLQVATAAYTSDKKTE